jgi:hypothetical protein
MIQKWKAADQGRRNRLFHLPGWVKQYRVRHEDQTIWLDLEPSDRTTEEHSGQMVVDLPPGRYMVEILDTLSGKWISRESATGGPLVAGLPHTENPLTVRISRVDK